MNSFEKSQLGYSCGFTNDYCVTPKREKISYVKPKNAVKESLAFNNEPNPSIIGCCGNGHCPQN